MEISNLIVGVLVIVINLIPLVSKKYKYLLLTSILSLLMVLLLKIGGFNL
ncbi:MAG: hypothetical protein ACOC3Z_01745 [Nanoarchaeota archaeon]